MARGHGKQPGVSGTPYALVSAHEPVREASKRELVGLTRRLERAALAAPPPAVAATMQDARYLTSRTRAVYTELAERGAPARLHGRGRATHPRPLRRAAWRSRTSAA